MSHQPDEVNPQPNPVAGLPSAAFHALGEQVARLERTAEELAHQEAELRAVLQRRTREAVDLERQLAVAEARAAVESMHAAGLAAQTAHLLALGAEAPSALEPTGELDREGTPKTRLTLVYEAAFDAKGAELGIDDPVRFRAS
ncbi:hypothetical protein [Roseomonas xinghualingensis]|uniref:hypothetical protein n=1 Tax=Roseomonas xinghualingensis TaxID=2986475 RepID=UPI0021F1A088|nr:hypothetical protein [Roseomonas sp. SXEYE001]MCV4206219.1 hypothetical protein [Roseomonas sp. SXEYE001]